MLLDILFEGFVVEAEVGAFGIELLFFQVIAIVTVKIADRPDGLDHDLKFTRRGFQLRASSRFSGTGGCPDGRAACHSATLLKKVSEVITRRTGVTIECRANSWASRPSLRALAESVNFHEMALNPKQQAVVRRAPVALLIVVAAVSASGFIPSAALPADQPTARMAWALPWAILPLLALMVSIMRVANHRFATSEDIDGSGLTAGTQKIQILRAVLQNTLEQTVLAVGGYLIGAVALPHGWLRVIPAAALLFVIGRILFAAGYARGSDGRALGFGLTAYPTFTLLVIVATILLLRAAGWAVG
jgi:MAPEG family